MVGVTLKRAIATLEVKATDEEKRIIEGVASTPIIDRQGDKVEPDGAEYSLPMPLLWQHRSSEPIGKVLSVQISKASIKIRAQVAKAGVSARIDEAWTLIKEGLVGGLSIGFRPIEMADIAGSWGRHFQKWEWLELSVVTIAANADAGISSIKSIVDAELTATGREASPQPSGDSDNRRGVRLARSQGSMKTIAEQLAAFEATRQSKHARMNELMTKSAEEGETLNAESEQEYDGLAAEVKKIDDHIVRLRALEATNKAQAAPVSGIVPSQENRTPGGSIRVNNPQVDKGIGFARYVMCSVIAYRQHRSVAEIAKARYPHYQPLHDYIEKAAVPGGTTTQTDWAAALVDTTNLASEFVEWLRPQTIIGKFGTGGIPALRTVPFNIRVVGQQSGGTGYWVGEGAPKPLTSFKFGASTLGYTKVAAIAVITEELARFSSPSAENLVRDALRDALVERIDSDFLDPGVSAIAGVRPASLTNGLTALSSAGTSADNVRTDLGVLLSEYVENNQNPSGIVLVMPNTLALGLSLVVNALGQREFPGIDMNGGNLNGIPTITSQYVADASGRGNMVVAINAREVFLADDGQVTVDASREASLQMLDNPTNSAASGNPTTMVSMFQTDSIALRAERFINWAKRRTDAVVYMDDVNWGAVGSP
jgi:HK97 family phage major capsid protein/HK97 family phage prohead protease